jgi:phenylalanyl-tRNA synthetase beta chain
LHSDSSYRFERGVDAHQTRGACDLAVKLILELAGGKADPEVLVAGELPVLPAPVVLDPEYCRGVIGADLSDATISGILTSLGLVAGKKGWIIPSYRRDLERPIDLVEEVARVHGLDQVPSRVLAWFSPSSKADEMYDFQRGLQTRLAALGCFEARNLKLISAAQLADDLTTTHRGMSPVRLKNPLNDEQDYLRPGLLPGLLASAARNRRFGKSDLRFFEMGRVFTASPKGDEIEHEHLALLMTGTRRPRTWAESKPDLLDLADLRAMLEAVCPEGLQLVPVEDPRLLGAVSIEVGLGKKATKLGLAGIVPPARARELDFSSPILVAELNLKKLASLTAGDATFAELPKFPGSSRDVAMLVPATLRAGEVAAVFAGHEETLLRSAELFDVFTDPSGQKLPTDRKSLAYSLHYRADDRTLSAGEVEAAHGKVLEGLKKALSVEFR